MAEKERAAPGSAARGPRIAVSALATLGLLAGGGAAFWISSPFTEVPTGNRAYLDRTGDPLLVVEADDRAVPMTVSASTAGLAGTVAALPTATAELLLGAIGRTGDDVQLERSLATQLNPDGSVLATTMLTLLGPDGYASAVFTGSDGSVAVYIPPRLELPVDATPGRTWSSEGMINFSIPYSFRGAISAAEPRAGRECIEVGTALEQRNPDREPYRRTTTSTWCEGRGSVESFTAENGMHYRSAAPGSVRFGPVDPPAAERLPTDTPLPSPFRHTGISLPPVVMGGLVISTNGSLGDLDAVHPGPDGQRVAWVQHPGGEVLGMAADDSLIYVATTRPTLMAFDAAGRLHWLKHLPDAPAGTPVTVGDMVVVALLNGTVHAYDRGTGAERWSVKLGETIAVPSVVTGGQIVSADTSGLVSATRVDGTTAWARSVGAVRAPMTALPDGGVLIQNTDGMLVALDSDGGLRWTRHLAEAISGRGTVIGSVAALPTDGGIVARRLADGSPAWRLDTTHRAAIAEDGWFAAGNVAGRLSSDGGVDDRRELGSVESENLRRSWPLTVGDQHLTMDASGGIVAYGDA